MKTKRILKPIAAAVVAALLVATLGGCFPDKSALNAVKQANAQARAQAQMARLAKERAKPTNAEKLTGLTEAIKAAADRAAVKAAKNKSAGKEIKGLKGEVVKLAKIDVAIRKEFARTEAKLEKISAKTALKRHAGFVKNYKTKMAKLKNGLADVLDDSDKAFAQDARALSKFIAATMPEERHQPLGASLPHRNVDYQAGPPTLGANIAPAYMAQVPELEPSSLPRTPTADDLAATIDTSFTPAIKELADRLDKDPVKIYEFVRNNMVFEPYYGSRKGAQETLWEKGGNDVDQANLLIALFRYSDKPSRYVTGVVEIPIGAAMNWVGVEKEEVAAKVFSAAGIPSKAIVSGGKISSLQIEHTWVEAYVNYGNYRGVDNDGGPKAWVALDGSFKEYDYKTPTVNLAQSLSIDATSLAQRLTQGASIDSTLGSVAGLDTSYTQAKMTEYMNSTTDYLKSNPNIKIADIIGDKSIREEAPGLLPNSLPVGVKPISIASEQTQISDNKRDKVTITAPGLNYTADVPEVAGKSITLKYLGATAEDRALLSGYSNLSDVPAYLMNVVPQLIIDGKLVATGSQTYGLGSDHDLSITLTQSGIAPREITNSLTAGGYYAVTLDVGHMSGDSMQSNCQVLKSVADKLTAANGQPTEIVGDDLLGKFFYLSGAMWFAQTDMVNATIDDLIGVVDQRDISLAMTGFSAKTDSVFGVPTRLSLPGFFIDVDGDNHFVAPKDGDMNKVKTFMTTSGMSASSFEGALYPTAFGLPFSGISTMSILRRANVEHVPIYTVTQANVDQVLPRLSVSSGVKEDIRNSVNQGREVTIPERNITVAGWTGAGYVVADPNTGAAGYMISGGDAGGVLLIMLFVALDILATEAQEMIAKTMESLKMDAADAWTYLQDKFDDLLNLAISLGGEIAARALGAATIVLSLSKLAGNAVASLVSIGLSFLQMILGTEGSSDLTEAQKKNIDLMLAITAVILITAVLVVVALAALGVGGFAVAVAGAVVAAAVILFSVLSLLWKYILPYLADLLAGILPIRRKRYVFCPQKVSFDARA